MYSAAKKASMFHSVFTWRTKKQFLHMDNFTIPSQKHIKFVFLPPREYHSTLFSTETIFMWSMWK